MDDTKEGVRNYVYRCRQDETRSKLVLVLICNDIDLGSPSQTRQFCLHVFSATSVQGSRRLALIMFSV
jgi:hypothetical protein